MERVTSLLVCQDPKGQQRSDHNLLQLSKECSSKHRDAIHLLP